MKTDEQLAALSYDIDGELNRLMHDHQIDPLSLCAVIMARTLIFVSEMGGEEDFKRLIRDTILKVRYENRSLQ